MAPTNITQQTSTALALQGELARAAPAPRPLARRSLVGRLQWALEGPGWSVLRPALDFVLMCVALTVAMGGFQAAVDPDPHRAPLLAMLRSRLAAASERRSGRFDTEVTSMFIRSSSPR